MISTISMPIWILVGAVGVADICLLCWCLALIRQSRKSNRRSAGGNDSLASLEQLATSTEFHQNLVCMQIDAVFDGLAALIDTERIKLKSLLGQPVSPEATATGRMVFDDGESDDQRAERSTEMKATISQQIAQIAASGEEPAGIANQLGISLAEVELAMKMQAGRRTSANCKLEAVA